MREQQAPRRNRFLSNNRWTGLLLLLVGGVLLLKQTGYPFPSWLFTEPYEKESYVAILKNGTQVPVSKFGYSRLRQVLGL